MKKIEIIAVDDSKQFVGFKIKKDIVSIYAPRALYFDHKNDIILKKQIINFIQSIQLARSLDYYNTSRSYIDDNKNLWDINSYLWLIFDYINHGLYQIRDKRYCVDNKGKVDWKRTLRLQPIVSNGNIIYDKLIVSKNISTDTTITEVYKYCINLCSQRIGWLFDLEFSLKLSKKMLISEMLDAVTIMQKKTFDDMSKKRLKIMKLILKEAGDNNPNFQVQTYGISHYYFVFEKMVDLFYGNVENKNNYYPSTFWHINNQPKANARLEPDTIIEYCNKMKNYTYILDSKMYRFGSTGNNIHLPGSQSIQKQIVYGEYLDTIGKAETIRNVFVIPYDKRDNIFKFDQDIEYFGYATAEWKNSQEKDYEYIIGILIDLNYLTNNYKGRDYEATKNLCELIEKSLQKIKDKESSHCESL